MGATWRGHPEPGWRVWGWSTEGSGATEGSYRGRSKVLPATWTSGLLKRRQLQCTALDSPCSNSSGALHHYHLHSTLLLQHANHCTSIGSPPQTHRGQFTLWPKSQEAIRPEQSRMEAESQQRSTGVGEADKQHTSTGVGEDVHTLRGAMRSQAQSSQQQR